MSPRVQHRLTFFARITAVVYTILICVLSLMPGQSVPLSSISDKYRHAAAYGVFAVLIGFSFLPLRLRAAAIAFVIASAMGVAIEYAQPRFGRSFDTGDMLANAIGAALGCALLIAFLFALPRPRPRNVLTTI